MNKENIVVELSGKASVVALLKFLDTAEEEKMKYNFIFSIAYVPSVYDEDVNNNIFALGEILKMHTVRLGHVVDDMVYSTENGVWFKMFKPALKKEFTTPCIGCMAYCHLCQLAIASVENADILTGERLSSGKTNQYAEMMDFYDKYFAKHHIQFIRPLLNDDNNYINKRYNEFCEEYGLDPETSYTFPKCWLSSESSMASEETKESALSYLDDLEELMDNTLDECINSEYEIVYNE